MKNLLLTMPQVDTLEEFVTQSIACNNWLFERHQEQHLGWRGVHQSMAIILSWLIKTIQLD